MAGKKRIAEVSAAPTHQRKRARTSDAAVEEKNPAASVLRTEEVDFPRGGGSNFTPVEYKAIRAEALKELKEEVVFKDSDAQNKSTKKDKRKRTTSATSKKGGKTQASEKSASVRVEHLNYKRIVPGMKLLCQVMAVYPFILIVSLPNQLLGHIPITQVSSQLTSLLEVADEDNESKLGSDDEDDGDDTQLSRIPPDLTELFRPGQYVRAVVSAVKPPGTTEGRMYGFSRDATEKSSRRVELSLVPGQVNSGLVKADLKSGFTLTAAVNSVEDHGYILDFGLAEVSGFLKYKRKKGESEERRRIGSLVDVIVEKLADDARTCIFSAEESRFKSSMTKEISSVSSLLPGIFVQGLVTATGPSGIVAQILGSFDGTVDLYHLPSGSSPSAFKAGQKIKARVIYDVAGSSPPQFALSMNEHVVSLDVKRRKAEDENAIHDSFPIGTVLQSVKVKRVESERGLVVSVEEGIDGFVHISHVSDEHVPSLSANSGPWKVDSGHQARVIGYHPFDGILQLSFRSSVLSQKFLRVDDVQIGEVVKGTVKKLTDSTLFVSINGNVDAMVWPNHYADILLKRPERRFKPGASVKCKVLAVDPTRKRIMLTAKKTLVESDLPIVTSLEDAEVGLLTHAVVCKVADKYLLVELYNNLRAVVPSREASETQGAALSESFPVGKPVKIRLISVDRGMSKIVASIRQASGEWTSDVGDIKSVEVGQAVSGTVSEVHRENALIILEPSNVRALISLNNVANHRGTDVVQLRSSLKAGEKMEELVVVSRNLDKGLVIVASRPSAKNKLSKGTFNFNEITVGSNVSGRILKYGRHGSIVKFPGWTTGSLSPTDTCDNYKEGTPFPPIETVINAVVIEIDRTRKLLTLSTRPSRLDPESAPAPLDKEINSLKDLKVGEKIRGFIKSVAEHGVFVTIGRDIDARVQIKELYDEYVKDWKVGFQANQLVSGRILSIDSDKRQVEMSFRCKAGASSPKPEASFSDLTEGQKVDGKVKKVEDFGVFITIDGTRLTGLCHKSEIADSKDADISMALRNFREGDRVKAIVLSVDKEKRRISLGLKPSYFDEEDMKSIDESEDDNMTGEDVDMSQLQKVLDASDVDEIDIQMDDNLDADDDDTDDDDAMDVNAAAMQVQRSLPEQPSREQKSTLLAPVLSLQGFQWSNEPVNPEENDQPSSDDESEGEAGKKRKKTKKVIEEDLTAYMHTKTPESVADYERHLLGTPNSSFLWIQYMAFQLQLAEIDKAREIGKRALKMINIREEQEKLNVWIALMNLESTYGSDESLEALFKDASRHNDSKTVHLKLAAIFDQAEKFERAEEQWKRTAKKFGQSSKVWTLFGEHYLRRGLVEEARKLLPRSLQSLEKRKHIKTISKFAQLEYRLGDPERGKTIFEGIIDSHPKRWDLWSIYIDMEAGQNEVQSVRNIFERVLSLKMTSHKAKSFFKKWLDLERRIGDEDGQRVVKEKAIEWTQRTAPTGP